MNEKSPFEALFRVPIFTGDGVLFSPDKYPMFQSFAATLGGAMMVSNENVQGIPYRVYSLLLNDKGEVERVAAYLRREFGMDRVEVRYPSGGSESL